MRILFCGDVVGRPGRKVLETHLPRLKKEWKLDWIIVNGENAAHGFGITPAMCQQFYDLGVDVITTGNHVWDQKPIVEYIKTDPRLLRPMNYPPGTPGAGMGLFEKPSQSKKLVVLHVMTRLFMEILEDPFRAVEEALEQYSLKDSTIGAIVLDVHGETTAEKMAVAHMVDGRVSLVVGTHTHVPTADAQILVKGTAYQTDAGMCGDYDSVIGMEKVNALLRFRNRILAGKVEPADGEATLCGTYLETDPETGLAKKVSPVRIGGRLSPKAPLKEEIV